MQVTACRFPIGLECGEGVVELAQRILCRLKAPTIVVDLVFPEQRRYELDEIAQSFKPCMHPVLLVMGKRLETFSFMEGFSMQFSQSLTHVAPSPARTKA